MRPRDSLSAASIISRSRSVRLSVKVSGAPPGLGGSYLNQLSSIDSVSPSHRMTALSTFQRRLSRKVKDSNNRKKARFRVAKLYARISDSRRDTLQKFTTKIIRENQAIFVEGLNVVGMVKNHNLAKHIADAAFGEIFRELEYAEHLGDESLTEREIEVLRRIAGGNRNRDIAEQLFISEETVKVHIKHIMEKLAANDRTQAVAIAIRRGIIQL